MDILTPDSINFAHYLDDSDAQERVRPAVDFFEDTLEALIPPAERDDIDKLPFADAWLYFAPGEVTLWGGYNFSGKSTLQGQVLGHFARHGRRVCIASMEMKPGKTIAKMVRQMHGRAAIGEREVRDFLAATQGTLWIYDQQGTVKPHRMVAVVKYCADKLGCAHIGIDNLMKCVAGFDDWNGQKNFVDGLTAAARDYGTHVHLVAHTTKDAKKTEKGHALPNRADIKGAGDIADLVDNVTLLWRNEKKEHDRDAGQDVDPNNPDAVLVTDKQRNNGSWTGLTKLWFEPGSLRYRATPLGGFSPRKEKA